MAAAWTLSGHTLAMACRDCSCQPLRGVCDALGENLELPYDLTLTRRVSSCQYAMYDINPVPVRWAAREE